MSSSITLALSGGDPQGIGPEVCARALESTLLNHPHVIWRVAVDQERFMQHASSGLRQALKDGRVLLQDFPLAAKAAPWPSRAGGEAAWQALQHAVCWVEEGAASGLVTAPLSKEAVAKSQPDFMGHTEFLGSRSGCRPLMMLGDESLRVFLVTTHVPLKDVPGQLTRESTLQTIEGARTGLRRWFGLTEPRLAVLSLNPHCGEGGALGLEELETIRPAVQAAGGEDAGIYGPFAADGFFGSGSWRRFDGVVAIFHDQGLIPMKVICGTRGVNVTMGLPYLRTSPDHGTAFGLVGSDGVDCASMKMALDWCIKGQSGRII
jgi:4-hydroxythreonine-4-phosphate dehydrogenase